MIGPNTNTPVKVYRFQHRAPARHPRIPLHDWQHDTSIDARTVGSGWSLQLFSYNDPSRALNLGRMGLKGESSAETNSLLGGQTLHYTMFVDPLRLTDLPVLLPMQPVKSDSFNPTQCGVISSY